MHCSVHLETQGHKCSADHVPEERVAVHAIGLVREFDGHELLRQGSHLSLGQVEFVQEVLHLGQDHVHLLAVLGVDYCSELECVIHFVFGDCDHCAFVLGQVVVNELGVRYFLACLLHRQHVVPKSSNEKSNKSEVFPFGILSIWLKKELLSLFGILIVFFLFVAIFALGLFFVLNVSQIIFILFLFLLLVILVTLGLLLCFFISALLATRSLPGLFQELFESFRNIV